MEISKILKKYYSYNKDASIYGKIKSPTSQEKEFKNRRKVAKSYYQNFYNHISDHHSIQVMDFEIANLLKKIPKNSIICDIGGCWGWQMYRVRE